MLYTNTVANKFQSTFNPIQIEIEPNTKQIIVPSTWNATGGKAYLNNGMVLKFFNNSEPYKNSTTNYWYCNYTVSIGSDMIISVHNGQNSGHTQPYQEVFSYGFTVNSQNNDATNATAIITFSDFFKDIAARYKHKRVYWLILWMKKVLYSQQMHYLHC